MSHVTAQARDVRACGSMRHATRAVRRTRHVFFGAVQSFEWRMACMAERAGGFNFQFEPTFIPTFFGQCHYSLLQVCSNAAMLQPSRERRFAALRPWSALQRISTSSSCWLRSFEFSNLLKVFGKHTRRGTSWSRDSYVTHVACHIHVRHHVRKRNCPPDFNPPN